MAVDPVCKIEVHEKKAAATAEHEGKTYYFCAPGCKKAFVENPEKYLKTKKPKRMARIIAVCSSDQKGTRKEPVQSGVIQEDYGLVGDAHANCCTHRQVSLLAMESIDKMRAAGLNVGPGDFAENVTTYGIDLVSLPVGTRLLIGEEAVLAITQIGKKCHIPCAIYRQAGDCIMPREGIFAEVKSSGVIKCGDTVMVMGLE